jgi:hypothetical protein
MKTSTFALLAGLVYLAAGLLGLVPALLAPPPSETPPTTFTLLYGYLLGLFPVNILHSALNIAVGAWGIAAWRATANPALFARSITLLFGALTLMGMLPAANTVFGWMPIFGHDVWFHALTTALAAYFGWRTEPALVERRSKRLDRRHRMQAVSAERRHGVADRRFVHARMMAGI